MELLADIFKDSFMQSMVFGPIMGVVFGALFSGLSARPAAQAPITVVQTRQVYITHIIERRGRQSDSEEGGAGILIAAGIAMLFVLWKYAVFVNEIHYYIGEILLTVLSFSVTAILLAYMRGQFTSEEWWIYLVSPLILLSGCFFLLTLAHSTFDPRITEVALQNGFWRFYSNALSEYGRNFMLTHVSGVVTLGLVIIFSFLALLHYLSLMNQRSTGMMTNFWFFLARITIFFSGKTWLLVSGALIVVAYMGIEPTAAASWLTAK